MFYLNIFLFNISDTRIKVYLIIVQHRQREKEYRQKLAELRENEKTNISTEEDLFNRLDELELEEELKDELCRLLIFKLKLLLVTVIVEQN